MSQDETQVSCPKAGVFGLRGPPEVPGRSSRRLPRHRDRGVQVSLAVIYDAVGSYRALHVFGAKGNISVTC